jgi:hypothetical protein
MGAPASGGGERSGRERSRRMIASEAMTTTNCRER